MSPKIQIEKTNEENSHPKESQYLFENKIMKTPCHKYEEFLKIPICYEQYSDKKDEFIEDLHDYFDDPAKFEQAWKQVQKARVEKRQQRKQEKADAAFEKFKYECSDEAPRILLRDLEAPCPVDHLQFSAGNFSRIKSLQTISKDHFYVKDIKMESPGDSDSETGEPRSSSPTPWKWLLYGESWKDFDNASCCYDISQAKKLLRDHLFEAVHGHFIVNRTMELRNTAHPKHGFERMNDEWQKLQSRFDRETERMEGPDSFLQYIEDPQGK